MALSFKPHFEGRDCEKFFLCLDFFCSYNNVLCKRKIRMIYYKCDRQGGNAIIVPLYMNLRILNLRIAKVMDFLILKDGIVTHRSIKIHKLTKFYVH
jgi:hypothetical protein